MSGRNHGNPLPPPPPRLTFLSSPAAGMAPRINQMIFTATPQERAQICSIFHRRKRGHGETERPLNIARLEAAEQGREPQGSGPRFAYELD